jgi:hypothetical protein
MLERLASTPLVLQVQKGCGFQRTSLDDHGLLFLSLLEWWRVPRRMNNRRSSSNEWFERERRDLIVYDGNSFDTALACKLNTISEHVVSSIPI